MNEADTCRKFVVPKLQAAGWNNEPHSIAEQRAITELRAQWSNQEQRSEIIQRLAERGVSFEDLATAANQPEADPFDLLCHFAFNARCAPAANARNACVASAKISSSSTGPRRGKSSTNCWRNTPGTARRSLCCPMCAKSRPCRTTDKLHGAVNELQTLLYAA